MNSRSETYLSWVRKLCRAGDTDMSAREEKRPFNGRNALVTGASRRIGASIATRLAHDGANVAVHYRSDENGAERTVEAVIRESVRGVKLRADLSEPGACEELWRRAEDALGPLDVWVNNAAIFIKTPLESLAAEDFERHMRVNAQVVFTSSSIAARRMRPEVDACIVNVADVAGERPWPAYIPYSASKAAVISLTRGFARALAPRVRVNAVSPGPMLPPANEDPAQGEKAVAQTLLKRWGAPEDVASAVALLVRATYLTGVVLSVDGGRSIA